MARPSSTLISNTSFPPSFPSLSSQLQSVRLPSRARLAEGVTREPRVSSGGRTQRASQPATATDKGLLANLISPPARHLSARTILTLGARRDGGGKRERGGGMRDTNLSLSLPSSLFLVLSLSLPPLPSLSAHRTFLLPLLVSIIRRKWSEEAFVTSY